jgi:hypothetical protein
VYECGRVLVCCPFLIPSSSLSNSLSRTYTHTVEQSKIIDVKQLRDCGQKKNSKRVSLKHLNTSVTSHVQTLTHKKRNKLTEYTSIVCLVWYICNMSKVCVIWLTWTPSYHPYPYHPYRCSRSFLKGPTSPRIVSSKQHSKHAWNAAHCTVNTFIHNIQSHLIAPFLHGPNPSRRPLHQGL